MLSHVSNHHIFWGNYTLFITYHMKDFELAQYQPKTNWSLAAVISIMVIRRALIIGCKQISFSLKCKNHTKTIYQHLYSGRPNLIKTYECNFYGCRYQQTASYIGKEDIWNALWGIHRSLLDLTHNGPLMRCFDVFVVISNKLINKQPISGDFIHHDAPVHHYSASTW